MRRDRRELAALGAGTLVLAGAVLVVFAALRDDQTAIVVGSSVVALGSSLLLLSTRLADRENE